MYILVVCGNGLEMYVFNCLAHYGLEMHMFHLCSTFALRQRR